MVTRTELSLQEDALIIISLEDHDVAAEAMASANHTKVPFLMISHGIESLLKNLKSQTVRLLFN